MTTFKVIWRKHGCAEEKYNDADKQVDKANNLSELVKILVTENSKYWNSVEVIQVEETSVVDMRLCHD